MLELRYSRYWQLASLAGLLLILAATVIPSQWLWSRGTTLGSDKLLHAMTFAFLAVWFSGQYARASYWRIAAGLLAFGVLIEICQQATTYRTAEGMDLLANLAGIAVGLALAAVGAGGWSVRFENWIIGHSERPVR